VQRARGGEGPTLIEARTYRWRGHVETEQSFLSGTYREESEIASWRLRDPIERLEAELLRGLTKQTELDAVRTEIEAVVEHAYSRAMADPLPAEARAFQDMFA
jgi:pyruvate dehydrogenase E1 component alpha subunit